LLRYFLKGDPLPNFVNDSLVVVADKIKRSKEDEEEEERASATMLTRLEVLEQRKKSGHVL
jgi:hypothetical protein